MKKISILIVAVLVASLTLTAGAMAKPGNGNSGNPFGKYVSELTGAHVPYAMNKLDLDFGKTFVKPYNPSTDEDGEIIELYYNKPQWWVLGPEGDYAAQWYTQPFNANCGREAGHEYVVIWSKENLEKEDYFCKIYYCGPSHHFPIEGNFYVYVVDVTDV